jgi:excisionase family DNA binding protein
MPHESRHALLTPAEVAEMFRVSPKTVSRWAQTHRISSVRTLGGHRRFRADEIRELLARVEEAGDLDAVLRPRGAEPTPSVAAAAPDAERA